MKTYDIFVQDKLFRSFESDHGYNIRDLAVEIENAVKAGTLVIDDTKPTNIRVVPR